jgi:hypothetical protein
MRKSNYIIIFVSVLLLSCNPKKEYNLSGEWVQIEKKEYFNYPPPPFNRPKGIGFTDEKVEFFNGFIEYNRDLITEKIKINYKGNFTDYEIKSDSIFIKNPFTETWEFKWRIKAHSIDTLVLTKNDSTFIKLLKIKNDVKITFDQIVFSSSGCFGSCPIIDISINLKNEVYFQGEGYVNPLGFYKSKVDSAKTNFIFSKFGKVNFDSLSNNYAVGHTDDQRITTTFIKDGKIIKTVSDYGKDGPKELVWAYIPISNLYSQIELDSLDNNELFYPKLNYYTFEKDSLILRLKKSESFFLWTEINKSTIVDEKFESKYSIGNRGNYTYFGPDPNKDNKRKYYIETIETDGQFFRFSFKGQKSITYDIGYNFIQRNYKETDFKAKTDFDY